MGKRKVRAMLPAVLEGELMTPADLADYDLFDGVDLKPLERFPGTIALRRFKQGEVICREGEGGTTAFYLLDGKVDIHIARRKDGAASGGKRGGLLAAIGRLLGQRSAQARPPREPEHLIPIDATVDLTYGEAAGELGPGDVFGEMSCMNLAPRSATVIAQTDCTLFEILRNMFEAMQASPRFKQKMDEVYRERALRGHLRNVSVLAGLPDEDLEALRQTVELMRVKAGETIFQQGDDADAMYIVRFGQVKVSQRTVSGERTLRYLAKGDCFGETGLLRHAQRNATCTAVDHPIVSEGRKFKPSDVELVKISHEQFDWLIQKHPRVKGRLEYLAEQRIREQRRMPPRVTSKPVEDLGLLQGQNLMLIDLTSCTRCDQCVDACVASHDDGVTRLVREGPRFDKYLVPSSCRMCRDPVCMIGCPVGSIRRTEDLNIFIEDWCIGCEVCAKQCPYDSIQMHSLEEFGLKMSPAYAQQAERGEVVAVSQQAVVCDQCSSLPTGPACVYACPHDAALRVDAASFFEGGQVLEADEEAES